MCVHNVNITITDAKIRDMHNNDQIPCNTVRRTTDDLQYDAIEMLYKKMHDTIIKLFKKRIQMA